MWSFFSSMRRLELHEEKNHCCSKERPCLNFEIVLYLKVWIFCVCGCVCQLFLPSFTIVLASFGVWYVAVPSLFRANKEGRSCPAGLCGSCLAYVSNEAVLCVPCKKLQDIVWSKSSDKYITRELRHDSGIVFRCRWCEYVKCVVCGIKVDTYKIQSITCCLRFSWSSTRLEPLWALVEECCIDLNEPHLNDERQLSSQWAVQSWESEKASGMTSTSMALQLSRSPSPSHSLEHPFLLLGFGSCRLEVLDV